jgi:preprotein translocase subunit SecF
MSAPSAPGTPPAAARPPLRFFEFFRTTPTVDFVGKRKAFYVLSTVLALVTVGSLLVHRGPRLGIDFTGGTLIEGSFEKPAALEDVRRALSESGLEGVDLQSVPDRNAVIIREKSSSKDELSDKIEAAVRKSFPDNPFRLERAEFVGPVIGRHLVRQSLLAVVFSLLGIIIYVAFRFKNWVWGAAGVLALAHDVFLTVGFLSVTDRELTITVIASLLTLAGYSINDTIVIFDRIRENLRMRRKEPLDALINRSLNETLSRTIITSGMVFFVLLALLFFGGEVLNDFAAALTFGVVVGSYSTWFIAVPLVFDWQTRRARPPQR